MADLPTLRARVEAAQKLAAKATPGPYHVIQSNNATPFIMHEGGTDWTDNDDNESVVVALPAMYQNALANAKMLAAAPDLVTLATDLLALAESQATQIGQALEELRKIGPADTLQAAARMATSKVDTRADALACALLDLAGAFRERDEARADLTAIRAALGNGADEAAWPPGLTVAEAVARLRGLAAKPAPMVFRCGSVVKEKLVYEGGFMLTKRILCILPAGHEGPHAEALGAGDGGGDGGGR